MSTAVMVTDSFYIHRGCSPASETTSPDPLLGGRSSRLCVLDETDPTAVSEADCDPGLGQSAYSMPPATVIGLWEIYEPSHGQPCFQRQQKESSLLSAEDAGE